MENKLEISPLEQLTNLQAELGYVKGELSTVAMLGLIGEAGEVLSEVGMSGEAMSDEQIKALNKLLEVRVPFSLIDATRSLCRDVEKLKKAVRNKEFNVITTLMEEKEANFDAELSDTFYYLNILATNRGLTINDLAKMAHDKVRAKQASGGSSEDRK